MKHSSKFMAALILGTMVGGVMALTSGMSQAGLKDDSCWDPKQVVLRDWIHSRNCLSYGRLEPNNADGVAPSQAGDYDRTANATPPGGSVTEPTPPQQPGDVVDEEDDGEDEVVEKPPVTPPGKTKKKSNKGFGNGEEFNGCKGRACFDGTFMGGESQNPSGNRPGRK